MNKYESTRRQLCYIMVPFARSGVAREGRGAVASRVPPGVGRQNPAKIFENNYIW